MKEPHIKELNKRITFAENLTEYDKTYFIFNHLRIACLESGIWNSGNGFKQWLEEEIKEIDKMIEYYEVNENGRTV